jgi:tRNA A-37 threonylcarbamoyl transferase component Bud32
MNIARAESSQGGSSKLGLSHLPPAMLETAASRLCWIAVACACVSAAMHVLQQVLQPEVALLQHQLPIRLNTAAVILLSSGVAVAGRLGWLSPEGILRLGLLLEVLVGFALSTFDYLTPWDPNQTVRGVSWMALWICLCGLLIPNRPRVMALTMLITASMGPLAYVIFYPTPIPINRLLMWNIPTYMVGLVTVAIGRRLYKLETEVRQAREMGSYQLETLIGKGGMGEVWRARHRMLARDSAIKLIRPSVLLSLAGKDATLIRRRFEQEARVTASLRSPHTVELYDFGVSDDGGFYYVMELLDGIDLETLVKQFGPQPPGRVVEVLRQVCQSLAEAHRAGLVHRDIKPTNIFLCRLGIRYDFAKVLDFGLVKTMHTEGETRMTREGVTTGTPAYMAPEVAMANDKIDGRADLYGLGCVAYWLLTGSLVFDRRSAVAMVMAHMQEAPAPPSQKTELPIPASLDRVVMACLAKKPEDRPATAEALARMLEEIREIEPWTQDEAEKWWIANRPGFVIRADETQHGDSVSASAMPTM